MLCANLLAPAISFAQTPIHPIAQKITHVRGAFQGDCHIACLCLMDTMLLSIPCITPLAFGWRVATRVNIQEAMSVLFRLEKWIALWFHVLVTMIVSNSTCPNRQYLEWNFGLKRKMFLLGVTVRLCPKN